MLPAVSDNADNDDDDDDYDGDEEEDGGGGGGGEDLGLIQRLSHSHTHHSCPYIKLRSVPSSILQNSF